MSTLRKELLTNGFKLNTISYIDSSFTTYRGFLVH